MSKNLIKKIIILASSFILAIFLVKPIGVSTEYSVVSGIIEKNINPNYQVREYYLKDNNTILNSIENPNNYGMIFVLSIPIGGYLGYLFTRKKEQDLIKKSKLYKKDYLKLSFGGFLLLLDARLAGSCTSGHMMSGIMQSSISSIIFAGVVFISGILFAIFLGGKNDN